MEITVKGIPSGDHECWCLLVTKEDYERITKHPAEDFDRGPFAKKDSPYQYMLYPHGLISESDKDSLISITVKSEVVDA